MLIYLLNLVFAVYLVFFREKNTSVTLLWLLIFVTIPIFGFILYLFFGYGIDDAPYKKENNQLTKEIKQANIFEETEFYQPYATISTELDLFTTNLTQRPLTYQNELQLFTDGMKKIEQLNQDILEATHSIHLEYYAFVTDDVGMILINSLTQKAQNGVTVRLLFDRLGSSGVDFKLFDPLVAAGGEVETFLTSKRSLKNFKANYHDHHKLVIIDGARSYIGGFNISHQYAHRTIKFGYWRDTHLRVTGPFSTLVQKTFLRNWNLSTSTKKRVPFNRDLAYDPYRFQEKGASDMQLITSGPDNVGQEIKLTFLRLIQSAEKRIWIQTPYLIPDDSIIDALRIAQLSGIDVKIMIPNKPDHPFIYRATQYYAHQLVNLDISIFSYNAGFLHSKVMIIDDSYSIVGSANQDIRSYRLNFEASALIYDDTLNQKLTSAFENDLTQSEKLSKEYFTSLSLWIKFKQRVARLLSFVM